MDIVTKDIIINDCIKKYPNTIGVFNKYNIDSCCGGAVSLEKACIRDGASIYDVLNDINKIIAESIADGGGK
jgi:regulator of cell morphogenesis and NO signaling